MASELDLITSSDNERIGTYDDDDTEDVVRDERDVNLASDQDMMEHGDDDDDMVLDDGDEPMATPDYREG